MLSGLNQLKIADLETCLKRTSQEFVASLALKLKKADFFVARAAYACLAKKLVTKYGIRSAILTDLPNDLDFTVSCQIHLRASHVLACLG
jgi:hypothetical protein